MTSWPCPARSLADEPGAYRERQRVTDEEVQAIREEAIASRSGTEGIVVCLPIGIFLRSSELIAMRWSHVDLEAGTVTFRPCDRMKARLRPAVLCIDPLTRIVLAEWKAEQARQALDFGAPLTRDMYVVPNKGWWGSPDGLTPLDLRQMHSMFKEIVNRAAVGRPIKFHDIRLWHGTQRRQGGVQ